MLDSDELSQLMTTRLDALLQAAGRGPLPPAGSEDRQFLFKAIAEAVVLHLKGKAQVQGDVQGVGNNVVTGSIK